MNVLDYDVCAFSANGKYVAAAISNRFIIKIYPFAGTYLAAIAARAIDHLQWNNSSDRVLCANFNTGVLQVYDISFKSWTHKFTSGYFKFIAAEWIGFEKILLTLEFHIALAVFDIKQNSITYIEIPKPIWPCAVFDNDGTHMFVVSKINGYEKLLMMHSQSLDRVIYIESIIGPCDGLDKSPDNKFLCVFNRQKLAILNFFTGNVIGSVDGFLLNTISWSTDGEYLALGCSSGNIIILASSCKFNVEFKLCYRSVNEDYDFYSQSSLELFKTKPSGNFINNPPTKIASIAWSFDGGFLSHFEVDSELLCIWKKYKLICVVKFSAKIKQIKWCQSENKLAVVFGTDYFFCWTEGKVPKFLASPKLVDGTYLLVSSISWSFNNKDIILSGMKKCILFSI